jgi:hypothetical protein
MPTIASAVYQGPVGRKFGRLTIDPMIGVRQPSSESSGYVGTNVTLAVTLEEPPSVQVRVTVPPRLDPDVLDGLIVALTDAADALDDLVEELEELVMAS